MERKNYKVTVFKSGDMPWAKYGHSPESLKAWGKEHLNLNIWHGITPQRAELSLSLGRNGRWSDWKLIANLVPGENENWVTLPDQSKGVNPSGRAGSSQWAIGR